MKMESILKRFAEVVSLIRARMLCRRQVAFIFLGIDSVSEDLP